MRGLKARSAALLLLFYLVAACSPNVKEDGPGKPGALRDIPDAVPKSEPRSSRGNSRFYNQFGKRYFVLPSSSGYRARGVASWYGRKFHGRATSSGEVYNMYAMTAAHKTLPLPTYARVTNLSNGKSIVVRVNDRGPFVDNRLIDLSYAAAHRLDMLRDGTSLVEVSAVDPGAAQTPQSDAKPRWESQPAPAARQEQLYAQVGAFGESANATRMRDHLLENGFTEVFISEVNTGNGQTLYRVRVGPVTSVDEYDALVERLRRVRVEQIHLAMD